MTVSMLAVQGEQDKLDARLYAPDHGRQSDGLIVFFPYGGFVEVDLDDCDEFSRVLAMRTGYRVLTASYTVAGVRPFPAAVEDAHAVLDWAARHCAKDGEKLIAAGIEAGGNLAAVGALMARDRGGPALAAQILIMPMLDPGLTSCSMRNFAGQEDCVEGYRRYLPRPLDRTHPYACPLQSSRMRGLPPALILSADDDPLRDEAEQYGAKLIAAGIKTVVRRLPPITLEEPGARCSCARKETALREVAAFITGL